MQLILVDGFWPQFFTFDPNNGVRDLITTALSNMQIFHNYARPHMGMNNETPADKAGIKINGSNK